MLSKVLCLNPFTATLLHKGGNRGRSKKGPSVIKLVRAAAGTGALHPTSDAGIHVLHLGSDLAKHRTSCKAKKEESEDAYTLPQAQGKGCMVHSCR